VSLCLPVYTPDTHTQVDCQSVSVSVCPSVRLSVLPVILVYVSALHCSALLRRVALSMQLPVSAWRDCVTAGVA